MEICKIKAPPRRSLKITLINGFVINIKPNESLSFYHDNRGYISVIPPFFEISSQNSKEGKSSPPPYSSRLSSDRFSITDNSKFSPRTEIPINKFLEAKQDEDKIPTFLILRFPENLIDQQTDFNFEIHSEKFGDLKKDILYFFQKMLRDDDKSRKNHCSLPYGIKFLPQEIKGIKFVEMLGNQPIYQLEISDNSIFPTNNLVGKRSPGKIKLPIILQ